MLSSISTIGEKLKEIRTRKKLSLDEVAHLTEVSKPMLGQIERGQSIPTITTLWKIATGLKTPLSSFLEDRQVEYSIVTIDEIEVMPMYFTVEEMAEYLEETLQGKHLGRTGGFYPTGRLSSVESIYILYEEDSVWSEMKTMVKKYPPELFHKLFQYHISRVLNEEDLGRAILRKDVLFYHQVLENSLDHLLQALYALNHTYFPSRKRIEGYIRRFERKPEHCYDRLLRILELAAYSDSIEESVKELELLAGDIEKAGNYN